MEENFHTINRTITLIPSVYSWTGTTLSANQISITLTVPSVLKWVLPATEVIHAPNVVITKTGAWVLWMTLIMRNFPIMPSGCYKIPLEWLMVKVIPYQAMLPYLIVTTTILPWIPMLAWMAPTHSETKVTTNCCPSGRLLPTGTFRSYPAWKRQSGWTFSVWKHRLVTKEICSVIKVRWWLSPKNR